MESISEQDFKEYMEILADILGTDAAYVYDPDTINTIVKAMDRVRKMAEVEKDDTPYILTENAKRKLVYINGQCPFGLFFNLLK
jgi:hypothetical protein